MKRLCRNNVKFKLNRLKFLYRQKKIGKFTCGTMFYTDILACLGTCFTAQFA